VSRATNDTTVLPIGFGTLKQEDISIKMQGPDVLIRLVPLDESVIRVLSKDSYRALHDLQDSKREAVRRILQQRGLAHASLWYVSFYGLAPDARFSPMDVTISQTGRDFRPIDVVPLRSGFGNQRLQTRETQDAVYVFDESLDLNQDLLVSLGATQSSSWAAILKAVERERVLIPSRAAAERARTP
jgi:hypothetical protein